MGPHGSFDRYSHSHHSHADSPKKSICPFVPPAFDHEASDQITVPGRVGSATISPCGRDIALASPDGLSIIDLDRPFALPRKLSTHGMPWLVVDAQWSPFASRDYWVVSTANHRALVWNLNMKEDSVTGAIEHTLQGHSRAITDINFSAHHPDNLSTCSVDGTVHCWDLRRPRQPVMTFFDWFAGATQVKYSRQESHIIASAHDRWLRIWDDRKSCEPVQSILAHNSKIYGIDWNRIKKDELITCSLDKTIKFWDLGADDYSMPKHVIQTMFPVWRARHTPFGGTGVMAIPQNEPGDMYLYDTPRDPYQPDKEKGGEGKREEAGQSRTLTRTEPVAVFAGHGQNKVKEFLWRARGAIDDDGTDRRQFSLVSWGEDNILRIQKPDASTLEKVGWKYGSRLSTNLHVTRKGATYKTFTTVDDSSARDTRVAPTMNDLRPRGPEISLGGGLTVGFGEQLRSKRKGMKARGTAMTTNSRKSDSSHIGWMKGVQLTKRKSHSGHGMYRDGMRRFSAKDAVYETDEEWAESETIRDEVIRIGRELPKLGWERVVIDDEAEQKAITVGLQGPWGKKKELIYFEVHILIPPGYPTEEAPVFAIDSTIFMDAETKAELERDIHNLAVRFQEQGKNSLHFIFSYLLGDVDLASSTRLFNSIHDLHDLADLGGDSSSDDDNRHDNDDNDDNDDNTTMMRASSTFMSTDLTTNTFNGIGSSTANINQTSVPLDRRTCGARFSHDGRLVCFFPTHEEKTRAIFLGATDASRDRKAADPYSFGFGRMNFELPLRPRISDFGSDSDADGSSEEASEVESWSSSDSESTSMNKMSLWYQPSGRLRMAWSESHSVHSSGGGTGTVNGTGAGRRRGGGRPKNIVVLHDLKGLLPSKTKYAKYYRVYGEDVCRHNADIAERYGRDYELRDVWLFCSLLLRKGIPLEKTVPLYGGAGVSGGRGQQSPVLVVAKQVAAAEGKEKPEGGGLSTRVRWGSHPMARQVVDRLFEHFERNADVQMLALLSCIFVEPSLDDSPENTAAQFLDAESLRRSNDAPLAFKAPGFALPFYQSTEAFWSSKFNSKKRPDWSLSARTTHAAPTPLRMSGSHLSEDALYNPVGSSEQYQSALQSQVTSRPASIGGTPPTQNSRDYQYRELPGAADWSSSQAQSTTQSLSASPNTRGFWKNNANNVAAQISAHIHFPRAIATAISSSPPNIRKGPKEKERGSLENVGSADGEKATGSSGGNVTWGPDTVMANIQAGRASGSMSDDGYRGRFDDRDEVASRAWKYRLEVPTVVDIMVEDQTIFDDDNVGDGVPLLGPGRNHLYEAYRRGYAELLQMWQLPLQRLEILKFNNLHRLPPQVPPKHPLIEAELPATPRALTAPDTLTLNVTGRCRIHETPLRALNDTILYTNLTTGSNTPLTGGAVGTCDRCEIPQKQLRCVYCLEPLVALYTACLACSCTAHDTCLAEWHAAGEEFCPAGDDCNCVEEASNGQIESWTAIATVLGIRNARRGTMSLGGDFSTASPALIRSGTFYELPRGNIQGPGQGLGYAADDTWRVEERKGGRRTARASMGAQEGRAGRATFRAGVKRGGTWGMGRAVLENDDEEDEEEVKNRGMEMKKVGVGSGLRRLAERSVCDLGDLAGGGSNVLPGRRT